jgi:hypothetical protein
MSIPTQTKPLNDAAVAAEIKASYEGNADTNAYTDAEKAKVALDLYAKTNILGTVSQTAGVPTGAIIERGSNANGEYVRFADGTQICTKVVASIPGRALEAFGAVYKSLSDTWTYPAQFSTLGAFTATPWIGVGSCWGGLGAGAANTTNTSYAAYFSFASTDSPGMLLYAIGRWF